MYLRLTAAIVSIWLLVPAPQAEATPYQLSYGGRLAEASGKPVSGPVDLRVTFFRSVSGADQVAVSLADFTGVALSEGVFQIAISLSNADFHTLFNGVDQAFIQVEDLTHGVTYPRQKFSAVPYALKVPVDGTSITYNANGRLSLGNGSTTLTLPATPGAANQVLKTNGSGVLSWANDETAGAGSVTSAAITDDTIANADINSNAAIAGTKISPNFGAQNIVTTGSVTAASFSGDGSALTNLPAGPLGTSVDSAEIVDDSIVNADIKSNAAIAGTKISPNFGAQNVVTTGSVTAGSFSGDGSGLTNLPAGALGTSIDSAEIVNDSIVNADVNTNAAIAGSKISPNFGAQNVVTTGSVTAASFSGDGSALTNLPAGPLGTSVDSAEIVDDSIVNADIKSNAAIAGSKINPDFGSQNVTTTGNVTGAEVKSTSFMQTGTSSGAPAAADCDASGEYGRIILDTTNNVLYVCSTSGWLTAGGSSTPLVPVRFTRAAVAYNASVATKDAACSAEFGTSYVTATFNDVPSEGWPTITFSQSDLLRFNTVHSSYTYHFNLGSGWGADYKANYGTAGSYQLACVHNRAPIRYTRSTIAASNTDAQKDALCVSEFGTKYMAASFLEIPLNMAGDTSGGNANAFNAAGATISFAHAQSEKNTIAAGSYSLACIIKP